MYTCKWNFAHWEYTILKCLANQYIRTLKQFLHPNIISNTAIRHGSPKWMCKCSLLWKQNSLKCVSKIFFKIKIIFPGLVMRPHKFLDTWWWGTLSKILKDINYNVPLNNFHTKINFPTLPAILTGVSASLIYLGPLRWLTFFLCFIVIYNFIIKYKT